MKIILYTPDINAIGGIETAFYQFAKSPLAARHKIKIMFDTASPLQLDKWSKAGVAFQKRNRDMFSKYYCDVLILGSYVSSPTNIYSLQTIQTFHADWGAEYFDYFRRHELEPMLRRKLRAVDSFVAVSTASAEPIAEAVGKCKIIHNFPPQRKNVGTGSVKKDHLSIVALTRATAEKGIHRLVEFANKLTADGVNATVEVYTPSQSSIPKPLIYRPATLDTHAVLANADYLIQLSDTESFCYSAAEALSVGTPIIIGNWRINDEFFKFPRDGFVVDDAKTFDTKQLLPKRRVSTYALGGRQDAIVENWESLIADNRHKRVWGYVLKDFVGIDEGFKMFADNIYPFTAERARKLQSDKLILKVSDV